jgi:hypothetical protein
VRNVSLNDGISRKESRDTANKRSHTDRRSLGRSLQKRISSSGQVGVYRHRHLWRALIGENGRLRHIGYFRTKALAAAAYRAAAKRRDAERFVREGAAALAKIQSEEDAAKRLMAQLRRAMSRSRYYIGGVHRNRNSWRATICVGGKCEHLGVFRTRDEAWDRLMAENPLNAGVYQFDNKWRPVLAFEDGERCILGTFEWHDEAVGCFLDKLIEGRARLADNGLDGDGYEECEITTRH